MDLPVPLSPSSAMRSPPATCNSTSENSVLPSYALPSPLTDKTSSPKKSRWAKRARRVFSCVGRSVFSMRSMRCWMDMARR